MAGRIDRLELFNFKSWAGKQTIGPFRDFTAVVGPNGSGKSNLMVRARAPTPAENAERRAAGARQGGVVSRALRACIAPSHFRLGPPARPPPPPPPLQDAICFVLGLSAKALRGDTLKDLVHSRPGGAGRGGGAAAAKSASVSLVFVPSEGESLDERVFSRRISLAGGGSSTYSVDGRDVSAADYRKALEDINIFTEARNFLIFQGDVDSVAAKSPRDMLQYFEVFSGSAEWK